MKDGFVKTGTYEEYFPFIKNAIGVIMLMHLAYAVLYMRTHACAQAEELLENISIFCCFISMQS